MQITVSRYLSTNEATLSRIALNSEFICYGLEDEWRAVKVPGETRTPAGAYKITLRTWGGFYERQKKNRNYRDIAGPGTDHPGMLWVRDVPGFEDILIHPGNTDADTAGCLLVGMERDELRMTISRSVEAYKLLYGKTWQAAKANMLYINYEDNDR